jgi:Uma2 family endonuclease
MENAVTEISQLDPAKKYSYADYLKWQLTEWVELIKGKVFILSPAPKSWHQGISMNISRRLGNYFEGKSCKVYAAPFDVRLIKPGTETSDEKIYTVVQPDISVICDKAKIDERGCLGSPDLIVEITSPGTEKKDLNDKYNLYEQNGVSEYWVVFAEAKYMNLYVLNAEGKYYLHQTAFINDKISSVLFSDFSVEGKVVFDL